MLAESYLLPIIYYLNIKYYKSSPARKETVDQDISILFRNGNWKIKQSTTNKFIHFRRASKFSWLLKGA